jgi:quinol-cytochrome oxidoreductase complex cytochrome b subunit/mono/diheme cytochrome c family protein
MNPATEQSATPEQSPAQPGFWKSRTGWSRLKQFLLLEPLPGGSRWAAAFGSLLLFTFVLQVVTGILLSMNYATSTETAWPSVKYIQEEVPLGAFIRAMHHWGSSAMVILLLVHLVQVFIWGAYKKPRELTWMVGVLLLLCTLGLAFTGYLLPWDKKAYWATKVGLGIISTTPAIGDGLQTVLQGGSQMGNLTLTRFFTIHTFLLPGLVILLVVVHLYLFRLHGVTPPWWESEKQLKAKEEPFWPKQALKDGVLALGFLVGLGLWAYYRPAPLEAQADPSQRYDARPEWYFMFFFQLLRYFDGSSWIRHEVLGTFVLPLTFFLVLFFWPFLDRFLDHLVQWIVKAAWAILFFWPWLQRFLGRFQNLLLSWAPSRNPLRRPVAMVLLLLGTGGLIGLTIFAIRTDVRMNEPEQAVAKASPPVEPAGEIQRADVARVYNTNCAACHGVDGSATKTRKVMPTIPDFTSLAWQMTQTEFEITHRIQHGLEPQMPAYRDQLSQREILALTIYVRAFLPTAAELADLKPAPPLPAPSQMSESQLYRNNCLACHEADGKGKTLRDSKAMPDMPDFTDANWQSSRSDADFKKTILDGKGKFMLPMKDRLSEKDVERMVRYVRDFKEGKQVVKVEPPQPVVPPPPDKIVVIPGPKTPGGESAETANRIRAATGLYRQYCLACHGSDGRGLEFKANMPTIPNFTDRGWQERTGSPQLAASILNGKGTLMPAFIGRVTDEQAQDLTAYVRAFGPALPPSPETPADDFEKRFREVQAHWYELQKQIEELSKPPRKP